MMQWNPMPNPSGEERDCEESASRKIAKPAMLIRSPGSTVQKVSKRSLSISR